MNLRYWNLEPLVYRIEACWLNYKIFITKFFLIVNAEFFHQSMTFEPRTNGLSEISWLLNRDIFMITDFCLTTENFVRIYGIQIKNHWFTGSLLFE